VNNNERGVAARTSHWPTLGISYPDVARGRKMLDPQEVITHSSHLGATARLQDDQGALKQASAPTCWVHFTTGVAPPIVNTPTAAICLNVSLWTPPAEAALSSAGVATFSRVAAPARSSGRPTWARARGRRIVATYHDIVVFQSHPPSPLQRPGALLCPGTATPPRGRCYLQCLSTPPQAPQCYSSVLVPLEAALVFV
jgi:hypothetical protein